MAENYGYNHKWTSTKVPDRANHPDRLADPRSGTCPSCGGVGSVKGGDCGLCSTNKHRKAAYGYGKGAW